VPAGGPDWRAGALAAVDPGVRQVLEGRVGFEPTTPGLKVTRSAAERRSPSADSNSAVLAAWTDRFLVESGAQV
jgi:hypothetical protein